MLSVVMLNVVAPTERLQDWPKFWFWRGHKISPTGKHEKRRSNIHQNTAQPSNIDHNNVALLLLCWVAFCTLYRKSFCWCQYTVVPCVILLHVILWLLLSLVSFGSMQSATFLSYVLLSVMMLNCILQSIILSWCWMLFCLVSFCHSVECPSGEFHSAEYYSVILHIVIFLIVILLNVIQLSIILSFWLMSFRHSA